MPISGQCCNGCLPLSAVEKREQKKAIASAVPIKYFWDNPGEQPIIADDNAFDDYVKERISMFTAFRKKGYCFYPWVIDKAVPKKWRRTSQVVWNQGMVPSCGSTATVHALEYFTLISIAEGNPVEYTAFNPIYTHYGATGGNIGVGVSMFQAGGNINTVGAFSVEDTGIDNKTAPRDYEKQKERAGKFKSAVIYIKENNPDRWFELAKAGLPLAFGSGQFYNGTEKDKNGLSVASRTTSGGHAECSAGCWTKKNGTEYIYIQNSHGDIYGEDETGKPKSGYWVTKKSCELLCSTADNYGSPFIPLLHCYRQDDASFARELDIRKKG